MSQFNINARIVLGYHGCYADVAAALCKGSDFVPSTNDYDWLGNGIYFWEANPLRALDFITFKRDDEGQADREIAVVPVLQLNFLFTFLF